MTNTTATRGASVTSPREQRRRSQLALGRTQLLDAAEVVFGNRGFHDASIKEIAELAEYSVGSVYTFFESKEDLFRQLFVRHGDEFMRRMREVVAEPGSAREQLHRLVEFEVGYFRENQRFARLYLRYSSAAMTTGDRLGDELIVGNFEEAMRLEAELIAAGQRRGELHPGDPRVLARLLSGMVAAFQAVDPAVVSDDPDAPQPMALAEFHAVIDRTFCR